MKKAKLIFLISIIMLMCTGCTIEYNIDITKNTINETIEVVDYVTSNRTEQDILKSYNMWYPVFVNYIKDDVHIEEPDFRQKYDNVEYYNKSQKQLNNGYNLTYKYNYNIDDYYDSYALASTFIDTTVQKRNFTLVLKTSQENLLCNYDEFDNLKVNITIDPKVYKLNYTNTNNIKNNTYTWNLNKDNCKDSQILLTLDIIDVIGDESEYSEEKPNKNKNKNSKYTLYIFSGVLIILILIGYKIFKKMKEKSEKFDIDD